MSTRCEPFTLVLFLAFFCANFSLAATLPRPSEKDVEANRSTASDLFNARSDLMMQTFRHGHLKDQPLGQYEWLPATEFQSSYENIDPNRQFQFAYDLHSYLEHFNYDWPNIKLQNGFKYMSYNQQKDFADKWFETNEPIYKKMGLIAKDHFLHDALIDATNIYGLFARRYWDSSQYQLFESVAVTRLVTRQ